MWIALSIGFAVEPPEPAASVVERVNSVETMRADGLRVVVVHHPQAQTVSVATVIDGGMVDEPREGLANELADSWFASVPGGDLTVQEIYGRLGADSGVEVEPDATVFWAHGPASSLKGLLALEQQRFVSPLRGLDSLARPSHPTSRRDFSARYFEPVFSSVYTPEHPYHGIWRAPERNLLLHDAAALAHTTWTPDRTTLMITGPQPPLEVLCAVVPETCGVELDTQELAAVLALPDPTGVALAPPSPPRFTDVGPLDAGVPEPLVLLAWAVPGTDSAASGAAELAVDLVEQGLRGKRRPDGLTRAPYCFTLEARQSSTLVCVLPADPSLDLRRWRRKLRRGWKVKDLAGTTQRWRRTQLARLLGSSEDPQQVAQAARSRHRAGEPTVHGGALERLAFDERDVNEILRGYLSAQQMVVVRLGAR